MKKHNKFSRIIATFFLLIFFPTLVPSSLYASNNGPAAPEATGFEPVDASDMVNLASGDMTYTLPVLNVPGPEGGYSMALTNHAGIAIDQEASWVGLGWGLNPGAINRSITGVPDDWKRSSVHQILFDAGGQTKTYSGGISIGFGQGTFSVGLYGSYSENKTFGGTTSYNSDGGVQATVGGMTTKIGSDGFSTGVSMNGMSTTVGTKGASMGYGPVSISQDFTNGNTSVGLNSGMGNLGISLSSRNGLTTSIMSGGFQLSGNNYSNGGLCISTQSYNISIPIYFVTVDFGFNKSRYWTYEKDYTKYNGSLYAGDMVNLFENDNFGSRTAFDSYNSIYKLDKDQQTEDDNLSYVAYDNYTVSGQGISGSIKPALLQDGSLLNNINSENTYGSFIGYQLGINSKFSKNVNNDLNNNDIHFYFENDPSSYFRITTDGWSNGVATNFSNNPIDQISDSRSEIQSTLNLNGQVVDFYDSTAKRKRTGNYIETFTNKEITTSNSTIIIKPENIDRSTMPQDGIGAFRITALDGKVYHYSLPVYQKAQFSTSTDLNSDYAYRYMEQQQLDPYATHWLLTAVTGPDYVDVNSNNMVDEADYGYWVSFDYGKWTDGFNWQTPEKTNDKTRFFTWGVKEIYYLDKIKTRTHTAFFVKSEREDDASGSFQVGNSFSDPAWNDDVSRGKQKGRDGLWYFPGIYDDLQLNTAMTDAQAVYYIKKSKFGKYIKCNQNKSLKLEKIIVVKNEDAAISKNSNQDNRSTMKGQLRLLEHHTLYYQTSQIIEEKDAEKSDTWYGNYYNRIYDVNDFVNSNIAQKAVKSIKFDYNYDLAKNSTNSINASKGRLTLKSVSFLGKNDLQLIPSYKFEYSSNNPNYSPANEDNWGYNKNTPEAWSLTKVKTPVGADINIKYESDDIDKVAVDGTRAFDAGLQFVFYQANGGLCILVQNEYPGNDIDFRDYFKAGSNTKLDLWASYRRDYDGTGFTGCRSRKGAININSDVQVLSVNSDSTVLQADFSACFDDNGGLSELFSHIVGLNYHPGSVIENWKRGEWGNPPGCINVPPRLVIKYFLDGNKGLIDREKNGGGIRVKEISVTENGALKDRTTYSYNVPGYSETKGDANYKSSGITSFVPQKYFKKIKYVTELPSPGVMYEYVTVKNYSSSNQLGITEEYNFEVLKPDSSPSTEDLIIDNILEIRQPQALNTGTHSNYGETYNLSYSKFDVIDKTSSLGRLKQKMVYNSNHQILNQIQNTYKAFGPGLTQETFSTYKKVKNDAYLSYRLGVTTKTKSASIPESSTSLNGGYANTTYFDNYDYLTGQVLETRTVTSDGKSFKTKIIPAYLKYSGMGAKVDNINNKNMLSQTAVQYTSILDVPTTTWKTTGVGITTWSNEWAYQDIAGNVTTPTATKEKIWRKHKSFVWNGVKDNDGIFQNYNVTTDDGFDWTIGVGSQPAQWKKTSEITLYDHYSKLLEAKDINNNRAATKMGDNDTKVIAVGNAGYNEIFYSGIENLKNSITLEPGISLNNASIDNSLAHTGKKSLIVNNTTTLLIDMKANTHKAGRYKLNVWIYKTNADNARIKYNGTQYGFNGESYQAGDWILKTHYLDLTTADAQIELMCKGGGTANIDDVMLRPIASTITGYVYTQWDELSEIVGNNGLATRFIYDAAGRLVQTYTEVFDDPAITFTGGFKLMTQNNQHYKQPL